MDAFPPRLSSLWPGAPKGVNVVVSGSIVARGESGYKTVAGKTSKWITPHESKAQGFFM